MTAQDNYFYQSLHELVTSGTLPDGHPLLAAPLDPFSAGTTASEKLAIRELKQLAGERWAYELRRLWYGYISSGRRISALRQGAIYLALYDAPLRSLLSDVFEMPALQLWDPEKERQFYERVTS